MRFEKQVWDVIRFTMELVSAGTGITGKVPVVRIQRIGDSMWWDGAAWGGVATDINMSEVDSTDLPGLYAYELPSAGPDPLDGAEGYYARVFEPTLVRTEFVRVHPDFSGNDLYRVLLLRQQNMRVTNLTFHALGQPETGTVEIYEIAADATADTNVIGEYSFIATYDGSGRLTSYVSVKVT